jgi:GGDEF domain-containing protein
VAARLGGDEFVVLLPGLPDDPATAGTAVLAAAGRVATALGRPYRVGPVVRVGVSVGAATVPAVAAGGLGGLLAAADMAMYAAKHAGGGVHLAPSAPAPAGLVPAPRRPATRLRDHDTQPRGWPLPDRGRASHRPQATDNNRSQQART